MSENGKFDRQSPYLDLLQAEAKHDMRECVVGALIMNHRGEIFAQKRSMDRKMFPGCWDIAGGHVEEGENLYDALAREILEETGWELAQIIDVIGIFDWELEKNGTVIKKREFDFLVEVMGDLESPQIETEKFVRFAWISFEDVDILKENREEGDTVIFDLIEQALVGSSLANITLLET